MTLSTLQLPSESKWAWQNTHTTRHIAPAERLTQAHSNIRISPRSGKTRKRPARPRVSLTDKLSNLHLLLRVKSFERWPLEVRFFAEDVQRAWQRWDALVRRRIRSGIKVNLEKHAGRLPTAPQSGNAEEVEGQGPAVSTFVPAGIESIDVGYASSKSCVEKCQQLLGAGGGQACSICTKHVMPDTALLIVCPEEGCRMISHLSCLSAQFLSKEGDQDAIVPTEGHCPSCQTKLQWSTLMKAVSLRIRGQKEIDRLFKKPRQKKAKATEGSNTVVPTTAGEADEGESDDDASDDDGTDDLALHSVEPQSMETDTEAQDEWCNLQDDIDDFRSTTDEPQSASYDVGISRRYQPDVVIEDSDWDDAMVLD
ncbi:Slx4p interacting protein [Coniosporium apollinis]|uniref:Slx4p interacting protein n=1 Tax=Coniosporium apollinis TaxID=61459 RepID=A0ABQ9NQF6_9PEZI|nr:Slx4p interacting protein [Coniosporium apollinis]